MRRPVCRDMRRDKYTFMPSNAQCFGCTPKFQKKLVQNQTAQTSQRLTGKQNKPFRCKNFDCVYCSLVYHQSVVVTNDCYCIEVLKHKGYGNAVFWLIISGHLSVHA